MVGGSLGTIGGLAGLGLLSQCACQTNPTFQRHVPLLACGRIASGMAETRQTRNLACPSVNAENHS